MERLSLAFILAIIFGYFLVLYFISYLTSRDNQNDTFFTGNKKSPWFVVAYGMVGAALSGVTFVSIPGLVYKSGFQFSQFIMGNIIGYLVITFLLIPLYYKMNLVSIYTFLKERFGDYSHKTGAVFFIISQTLGAALRMLLAVIVLREIFSPHLQQYFDVNSLQPIWILSFVFFIFIFFYTFRSGIKTIVWTDMLQTTFLLLAAISVVTIVYKELDLSFFDSLQMANKEGYLEVFNFDINSGNFFGKQFVAGVFISIAMMGLDQNMMQKSLTIAKVGDAQKNTFFFSIIVALSQLFFLFLGVMLLLYAKENNLLSSLPMNEDAVVTDRIFPFLAVTKMAFGQFTAVLFILGIIAAAFSSSDSSVAAITTTFCYDLVDDSSFRNKPKNRIAVQIGVMCVMFLVIIGFSFAGKSVVNLIFTTAAFTYSPLLALFFLGIFTKIKLYDKFTPIACILGPILSYIIWYVLKEKFEFDLGFFNIVIGAVLTSLLLVLARKFNNYPRL